MLWNYPELVANQEIILLKLNIWWSTWQTWKGLRDRAFPLPSLICHRLIGRETSISRIQCHHHGKGENISETFSLTGLARWSSYASKGRVCVSMVSMYCCEYSRKYLSDLQNWDMIGKKPPYKQPDGPASRNRYYDKTLSAISPSLCVAPQETWSENALPRALPLPACSFCQTVFHWIVMFHPRK